MGAATYHRMDIARPNAAKEKRKKRIIYASVAGVVLIGITVALSQLKPAAPTVEKNLVWIDTVKRGPMVRDVRGLGTLVVEQYLWIPAAFDSRVDKINFRRATSLPRGTSMTISPYGGGKSATKSMVLKNKAHCGMCCRRLRPACPVVGRSVRAGTELR